MEKTENTDFSLKSTENTKNNSFSLLLPYYTSDKWTNKLKHKIKTLADAYNDFYNRMEQENNPLYNKKNIKYKTQDFFHKISSNNLRQNKTFNKTSIGFLNHKSPMNTNETNNYSKKQLLNEIFPPITNYNPNYENLVFDGINYFNLNDKGVSCLSPKSCNLFCISAQRKNQNANMNKFYNNNKKSKDMFYYGNNKNTSSSKNLFSSKAYNDDFYKFINECQSKDRINFFKKNDYNPQIKSAQPKNRKQISAFKDIRKKQYLDYIKAKSEDNYMKFYYNQ